MKKIYILLLTAITVMLSASCEDRLDIAKHGNMGGQEDFYQTDEQAEQAAAALYLSVRSAYYDWFFVNNMLSDDAWCGGGSRGDNNEYERLNEYTYDTDHSTIQSYYSDMYAIIYNANLIIEKVADDTPLKRKAVAEAKFWRAWANFELVTMWGNAPLVDHLLATDEYRPTNSTPAELWSLVEQDLNEAVSSGALNSKESVTDADANNRVTTEAAEALLGKAYLFEGKSQEAATMLDRVISSGKYQLETINYDKLLHVACNNGMENILELQKRNDPEQQWNQFDMTHIMIGWRTSVHGYSGQAAAEIAQGTYGFLNPTKDLYDAFVAEEGAGGYRLMQSMRTADQMADYGLTLISGAVAYGVEGVYPWKTRTLLEDVITDASYFQALQYINPRLMRYAEVLLLAAEANVQQDNAKATRYVNMVRQRAGLSEKASVTLSDIKLEKRLELCLEGIRYKDLIRWGDAAAALKDKGSKVPSLTSTGVTWSTPNSASGFKERNQLLPIPLKEIELNPNIQQNPNW